MEITHVSSRIWLVVFFILVLCIMIIMMEDVENFGNNKSMQTSMIKSSVGKDYSETCIIARIHNVEEEYSNWILYHEIIGIDKFFLMDDCSYDKTEKIILDQNKSNVVYMKSDPSKCTILRKFHDREEELTNTLFKIAKEECNWIIHIDLDEFIAIRDEFYTGDVKINKHLEDNESGIVRLRWYIMDKFGCDQPNLINSCFKHSRENVHIKSGTRIKDSRISGVHALTIRNDSMSHCPIYDRMLPHNQCPFVHDNEEKEKLVLNHYLFQSFEFYMKHRGSIIGSEYHNKPYQKWKEGAVKSSSVTLSHSSDVYTEMIKVLGVARENCSSIPSCML